MNVAEVSHAAEELEREAQRQYEHIKAGEKQQGRSEKVAERIAAATVNKTRAEKGEAKSTKAR